MNNGKRHIVIPDAQVKKGVKTDHLEAIGNYIADKRPDVIVQLGDFADMPSLSTFKDKGHIEYEGLRYSRDIGAAHEAMCRMTKPFKIIKGYKPRMILTLGNHEDRINRLIGQEPKLKGTISISDLDYELFGWEVIPFRQPKKIDGITYCHYFVTGKMDRPIESARGLIIKNHQSCFAGHQQGRDIAYGKHADGRHITSIIAGSFYDHKEKYMSPQSNNHWRGAYYLTEVKAGSFDEVALSLNYLKRKWL